MKKKDYNLYENQILDEYFNTHETKKGRKKKHMKLDEPKARIPNFRFLFSIHDIRAFEKEKTKLYISCLN